MSPHNFETFTGRRAKRRATTRGANMPKAMTRDAVEVALDAAPEVRWWDTGGRPLDGGGWELRYLVSLDEGEVESWTFDEVCAWLASR